MPLMNAQYDSIMRLYARRQADSRRELEERLERIQNEIPELRELDSLLTGLYAGKARATAKLRMRWKKRFPAFLPVGALFWKSRGIPLRILLPLFFVRTAGIRAI